MSLERVKTARHSDRPYILDFIGKIFQGFIEIHGDRRFGDDSAIICGFANYYGREVAIVGQQKGRDIKQRRYRHFGMPKPEGYRKALRFMKLSEKFARPILTFIDTPGAYPGIDAEERGQAEAIARNILEMAKLKVPIIISIIGEGGSGGALALGVGDRVLMFENAVYSVISPEGCASILWKDGAKSALAADSLKLTAQDLYDLAIVDDIVEEPAGGAHLDVTQAARFFDNILLQTLEKLELESTSMRQQQRYKKLRSMGVEDISGALSKPLS
jgi:acetyl-CoA carboxylase carboxyl transferase subunit alpha